jgi:hypothetical protein
MTNAAEWWPRVSPEAQSWLRKFPRTEQLPGWVGQAVFTAGGPIKPNPHLHQRLSSEDWDYIENV